MIWWIVISVAALLVIRHLWRSYSHPYYVLIRQAANMDWIAAGTSESEHGYRDIRLRRGNLMAEISFKHLNVRLLQPAVQKTFKDFVELERKRSTNAIL